MKLLKPSQVAELFGVTTVTVWNWTRKGFLKSVQSPSGRNRYTLEEVNRVLKKMGLPLYKK